MHHCFRTWLLCKLAEPYLRCSLVTQASEMDTLQNAFFGVIPRYLVYIEAQASVGSTSVTKYYLVRGKPDVQDPRYTCPPDTYTLHIHLTPAYTSHRDLRQTAYRLMELG